MVNFSFLIPLYGATIIADLVIYYSYNRAFDTSVLFTIILIFICLLTILT